MLPIEGQPTYGIFSFRTIFSLIFGTNIGIIISIIFYQLIAGVYSYLLFKIYTNVKLIAIIFSLLCILNVPMIMHLGVGHFPQQTAFFIFPILYYWEKRNDYTLSIVIISLIFIISIYDSFSYGVRYNLIFFLFYSLITSKSKKDIYRILNIYILVALICLPRLALMYVVMIENPRVNSYFYSHSVLDVVKIFFNPLGWHERLSDNEYCFDYHELGCFIAPPLIILWIKNFKKYLFVNTILVWLIYSALFKNNYWSLSYLLNSLPGFSSHMCDSRLLILIYPLFMAIVLLSYPKINEAKSTDRILLVTGVIIQLIASLYLNSKIFSYEKQNYSGSIKNKITIIDQRDDDLEKSTAQLISEFMDYKKSMQYFSPYNNIRGLNDSEFSLAINSKNKYKILNLSTQKLIISINCTCAIYLPIISRYGLLINGEVIKPNYKQVTIENSIPNSQYVLEFNHKKYTELLIEKYINTRW